MPSDTLREIIGTFARSDATRYANQTQTWFRVHRKVTAQGDTTVIDDPIYIQTDATGQIDAQVLAGYYTVLVPLKDGDRYFNVTVPDAVGPHNVADLLDYIDPGDPVITQVQQLILKARAWAENPENIEVDPVNYPGEYSSRHHALKAKASALTADTHKDTWAAAVAATDIAVGQVIAIESGHNGTREYADVVPAGSYAAPDGVLVRAATGISAQIVSKRKNLTNFSELDVDVRPHPAGTILTCQAISAAWEIVATGEHFTTTGGRKVKVLPGGVGHNILAFGIPSDGTAADMTRVDEAYAATAGKVLHFPNGVYSFSRAPNGSDSVHLTGDPFTAFTNFKIPLFMGIFVGNKQVAKASFVWRKYKGTDGSADGGLAGSNYIDGETVTLSQAGGQASQNATAVITTGTGGKITGIASVSNAGTGYILGAVKVTGSAASNAVLVVSSIDGSGGVTALEQKDGVYLIQDKPNANHDPILAGPVTLSGAGSFIIDMDFDEFGISLEKWTPSGGAFSVDETYARSGATFGGSVSTDDVTVGGGFGHARESLVSFDGTSWSVSNGGFTVEEIGSTRLALRLTRTEKKLGHVGGSLYPALTPHINNFSRPITPFADDVSEDGFLVYLWDIVAAAWIAPGDANLTDVRFHISDAKSKGNQFNFADIQSAESGANGWVELTFTKKAAEYPT